MFRLVGLVVVLGGCEKILDLGEVHASGDAGSSGRDGQAGGGDSEAMIDAGAVCVGQFGGTPAGLFRICLPPTIPPSYTPPAAINTGNTATPLGDCALIVKQTDADKTEVCVFAAESMTFNVTTRVTGTRPLVLATTKDLTISGTLNVASHVGQGTGPGHDFVHCGAINGAGNSTGATGGAGGSFQLTGGSGGSGSNIGTTAAITEPSPIAFIRGGCKGGNGGATGSGMPGAGGSSGGALYLIAGGTLTISGTIEASGAAGGAGVTGMANAGAGAGGGGSGGLVGLDARAIKITATAKLLANGGGGGGGATNTTSGGSGGEANSAGTFPYTAPGGAAASGAGIGGAGGTAYAAAAMGLNAPTSGTGGGGGGGGVGWIELYTPAATIDIGAKITPAQHAH